MAPQKRKETTWADYGIRVDAWTFAQDDSPTDAKGKPTLTRNTAVAECPRCHSYRLILSAKAGSWHCDECYWSGKLRGGDAEQGQGLVDLADAMPMLERWHSHGRPPAFASGIHDLDAMYQPRRGEVTVITGYPGDGKSTWLKWYLIRLALNHGGRFAIFSPEDMPFHLYLGQMVVKVCERPFDQIDARDLKVAATWVRQHFAMIDPPDASAEGIIAQVRVHAEQGFHGVVIDPWTEVEHKIPPGVREDQYINSTLSTFRRLARFLHIHLWIVVHPRSIDKVANKGGKKEMPVPSMDDLAGGAMWKNKPDHGLAIHRPYKGTGVDDMWVDLHDQKARFSGFLGGGLGTCRMVYERGAGIYFPGAQDGQNYDPQPKPPVPLDVYKDELNSRSSFKGYFDNPNWTWPPRNPAALRPLDWQIQDEGGWWHDAGKLQAFIDKTDHGWNATVKLKADAQSRRTVGPLKDVEAAFTWAERTVMDWEYMADPRGNEGGA